MTKQEKIREVIEREIEDTLKVCGQNPITAKALAMDTSLDIVMKLHSQNVVIAKYGIYSDLMEPLIKEE